MQQPAGHCKPRYRLHRVESEIVQREAERPIAQRMPQFEGHQEHREGDASGLEHFHQQIVGTAAELPGGEDERRRRDAVAVEQPVQNQSVRKRIAKDFRVEDQPDQHGGGNPERDMAQHRQLQAAFDPGERRQVHCERNRQPGIFEDEDCGEDGAAEDAHGIGRQHQLVLGLPVAALRRPANCGQFQRCQS